jgi:hypothetical protein
MLLPLLTFSPAEDKWYIISPGFGDEGVIAEEISPVTGVLAPVTWTEVFYQPPSTSYHGAKYWKAVPPSDAYVTMGCIGVNVVHGAPIPSQPPAALANRFRAVHKAALTAASNLVNYKSTIAENQQIFKVDSRFLLASNRVLYIQDCLVFNPKMVTIEHVRSRGGKHDLVEGSEESHYHYVPVRLQIE